MRTITGEGWNVETEIESEWARRVIWMFLCKLM